MARMIFTGLSPNAESDDVRLALSLLTRPWTWQKGDGAACLERAFRDWLPIKHAFAFESGRTGLFAILSALGLERGDEVLLQAYTCVAVPNAIRWAGGAPVFVDVEEGTFNMSSEDLERKITPKSRALIVQHTFGRPADMERLLTIARQNSLYIIEDCAHALGAETSGRRVGTLGDAAFFSFGRDKVISSVFGGLVATNRDDTAERLRAVRASYRPTGRGWVAQQLLHPVVTSLAKTTYNLLGFGRVFLALAKRCGLISKSVYPEEKRGERPAFAGHLPPNALALLALHQFAKLARFNDHRRALADIYMRVLASSNLTLPAPEAANSRHVWLRYTVRTPRPAQVRDAAKQQGILLGDWYDTPVAPLGTGLERIGYRAGSCPVAEKLSSESLNLPTGIHIIESDARRIASLVAELV